MIPKQMATRILHAFAVTVTMALASIDTVSVGQIVVLLSIQLLHNVNTQDWTGLMLTLVYEVHRSGRSLYRVTKYLIEVFWLELNHE